MIHTQPSQIYYNWLEIEIAVDIILFVKEISLPKGINTEKGIIPFRQIRHLFETSIYGTVLGNQTRYDRYKPDGLQNSEWERLLGADANNLKHLPLSYGLTRSFISYCINAPDFGDEKNSHMINFTSEDTEILLLAAISHDWAEAIVGDKMFDLKTDKEEKEERTLHKILSHEIIDGLESNVLSEIMDEANYVSGDRYSKLGQAFNAIERLGYLRTALRAWEQTKKLNQESDKILINKLHWLINNVFLNQIKKLLEYSQIYPPVKLYLKNMEKNISETFNGISMNQKKRKEKSNNLKMQKDPGLTV